MNDKQLSVLNNHAKSIALDTIFDYVKKTRRTIEIRCVGSKLNPPRWWVRHNGKTFKDEDIVVALNRCFENILENDT